jgi:hypothetical protein
MNISNDDVDLILDRIGFDNWKIEIYKDELIGFWFTLFKRDDKIICGSDSDKKWSILKAYKVYLEQYEK